MYIANKLSTLTIKLNKKSYLFVYIFILLFMVANLYNYYIDFQGKKFFWNWIIYSLNQSITSNFVFPILFICMINYLLSGFNNNETIKFRMENRFNIFKFNILMIIYNTLNFIIIISTIILLLSFSVFNFTFTWNKSNITSFYHSFNNYPFQNLPIIQVIMSIILLMFFLMFWGIINQILVNIFKNKSTPIFIIIFLLVLQGKFSSIPGVSKSLVKLSPGNHFMIYSIQFNNCVNHSELYALFMNDLLYWIICIIFIMFILNVIYKHKQFN